MLRERKRKILATYETTAVRRPPAKQFHDAADEVQPPEQARRTVPRRPSRRSSLPTSRTSSTRRQRPRPVRPRTRAARREQLGEKYQVDELAGKYEFTGRETMTVPKALEIKEELETIDKLLKQLEEAKKTAQIGDHRHGGAVRVRRAGRHRAARAPCSSRSRSTSASRPSSRGSTQRRQAASRLTPEGLSAVPVESC